MAKQTKGPVINKITLARLERRQEDIASWQTAIKAAENIYRPRRRLLMQTYQRIMLDAFLYSFTERRIQEITNQEITVKNEAGDQDEQMMAMTKKLFFRKMLRYILEARFYGHSLIEPVIRAGKIVNVQVVPRHHVVPEEGVFLPMISEVEGISFREGRYARQLLEVGDDRDLGLLHRAAPYVLYKQGEMADWAQFCELFGMPIREYKYAPHDVTSRAEAEKAAKEMGGATYIIVPEGVDLTLHQAANATGSSDLFGGFRQAMNNELAVLILGNQLTSQNEDTGAYSLGEIHADEQNKIHADDMRYVESILNDSAMEFLSYWGIAPKPGYVFEFDRQEHLSIAQRVDVDVKLASQIDIPDSYFYERYSIPVPTAQEKAQLQARREANRPPALKDENQEPASDEEDHHPARAFYSQLGVNTTITAKLNLKRLLSTFNTLVRQIFEGSPLQEGVEQAMILETARQLVSGWAGSYNLVNENYDEAIRRNIFTFAGAKTFDQIITLRDAVYQQGRRVPFTQFRELAKSIWEDYNEAWLQAEYNQVVRSGTMAQKWERITQASDQYPYLQYETQEDDRVRPTHQAMHGITLPVTDSFWKEFYPPNGWNCRCTVKQIRRDEVANGKVKLSAPEEARELGAQDSNPFFRGNVGRDGYIFRDDHPYFQRLDAESRQRISAIVQTLRSNGR